MKISPREPFKIADAAAATGIVDMRRKQAIPKVQQALISVGLRGSAL